MSEAKISRLAQIQDPALRTFAESLASGVCAAGFKAAAHHSNPKQFPMPPGDTIERRFLDYLRSRPLDVQQRIVAKALPLVTNKHVPGMEGVDLASTTPVIDHIASRVKLGALTKAAGQRATRQEPEIRDGAPGFRQQDALDQLTVEIVGVQCINKTDPEAGRDDMAVGGVMVDAGGATALIPQIKLGTFGNNHDVRWFGAPLHLATMDMRSGTGWPKTFSLVMTFVELDNGSFPAFLQQVLAWAKDAVVKAVKNATGTGDIADAIAAGIGWLIDKVIGFIKEWWEDDVLKPMTIVFEFDSADARFNNGQSATGPFFVKGKGQGGEYDLWCNAKLTLASEMAEAGGAVVYEGNNYGGKAVKLPVGHYTLAQLQARGVTNDNVSSLKVGAGLRMIAYQHDNFQGTTRLYTGATNRLTVDMNDQISSLVIEPVYVMLFKDASYAGPSQAFALGRYDAAALKIGNDQASSVLVPPGYKVTLYKDAGFKGATKVLTADTGYVGADFNDVVSSLVVELAWEKPH